MHIEPSVTVGDTYIITLQVGFIGLACLIAQTLALILRMVLNEHLVCVEVTMQHNSHL